MLDISGGPLRWNMLSRVYNLHYLFIYSLAGVSTAIDGRFLFWTLPLGVLGIMSMK
jgi:hypothetical protein